MNVLFWLVACAGPGDVVLQDADNFDYSATVTVPSSPLDSNNPDAALDWSGVSQDLLGQPMAASDVASLQLLQFPDLTLSEFQDAVAVDGLVQSMLGIFAEQPASDDGLCRMDAFAFEDSELGVHEDFLPGTGTWVVVLIGHDGETLRFQALEPTDGGPEVAEVGTGAQIVPDVTLAPAVPVDGALTRVDWGDVTQDGLGAALEHHRLDRLTLARVDVEPSELEERFAELDALANPRYDVDLDRTVRFDVQELDGFDGLDGEGTWLVALSCSTCGSPVPKVLAVLEP